MHNLHIRCVAVQIEGKTTGDRELDRLSQRMESNQVTGTKIWGLIPSWRIAIQGEMNVRARLVKSKEASTSA